jgi:hypothetical protein
MKKISLSRLRLLRPLLSWRPAQRRPTLEPQTLHVRPHPAPRTPDARTR